MTTTSLSSRSWRLVGPAVLVAGLAIGSSARAEPAPDSAKAESLFREATRLLETGEIAPACARFAESRRLEPGIGVTLYLGECYERLGRTASAWGAFTAAENMARAAHDPRARVAHDRAARLEARLSKVILVVDASEPELEVKEDGVVVGSAQWGIALPVDPGDHRVSATAPHRRTWERDLEVSSGTGLVRVEIPALDPRVEAPPAADDVAPVRAEPSAPPPSAGNAGATQRAIALVTLGLGVVAVGAGSVFGLEAKSKLDGSNANGCNPRDQCDPSGLAQRSDGLRDATISTVAFVAGGAALLGGVLLYVTSPSGRRVEIRGGPAASTGGGEVSVAVRF